VTSCPQGEKHVALPVRRPFSSRRSHLTQDRTGQGTCSNVCGLHGRRSYVLLLPVELCVCVCCFVFSSLFSLYRAHGAMLHS